MHYNGLTLKQGMQIFTNTQACTTHTYGTVNAAYTTAVAAVSPTHHHGNQDNGCASLQMCYI